MSTNDSYEFALVMQQAKALETVRRAEILIDDEKEQQLLSMMIKIAESA